MKRIFYVIILFFVLGNISLNAADNLLPSDVYKEQVKAATTAVAGEVSAPSLRAGSPWGSGPGSTEEQKGEGDQVNAPIGDAVIPILVAGLLYALFLVFKDKRRLEEAE